VVRTRMPGGVGGKGREPLPIPIVLNLSFFLYKPLNIWLGKDFLVLRKLSNICT
jgi:hypothetical protein